MKTSALLLLIGSVCLAQAIESTAWQWVQPFAIDKPGIVRLDLSPAVINASRPLLEDIRLLSPAGSETPFVIENVLLTPPRELSADNPHFSLGDQTSTFEMETGTTDPIEAVVFGVSSDEFLKAVRLEASNDGTQWNVLAANDVLFRQSIGASRLRIPFASGSWKRLRLILDDHETKRVILTSARFEISSQRPVTTPGKATLVQTEELPGETHYTIDLGAANLHMASLKLNVTDPVLSRKVRAFYTQAQNGVQTEVQLATSILYRVSTGNGVTAESMDIPIHQHVPSSKITLVVENRGSPPLHPTDVTIERHPQALLFFAQESGAWRLITGNSQAKAPSYDVSALQKEVGHATTVSLTPGSLAASTGYQSPPALPDIAPEGALLDVSNWHYRKVLSLSGVGVFHVELDAETLAHAQSLLGDLRIVQAGKQLPFILERTNLTRVMTPEVMAEPDAKRPSVSVWHVKPSLQDVPIMKLSFTSPTPLFERTIKVWRLQKERSGRESHVSMGSDLWAHSSPASRPDFIINLNNLRAPEEFFIETDNGDNPPISIENVQLHHQVVSLVTKFTDASPAFLYYGNDKVFEPRYDLRMVKKEMLSAPHRPLAVGPEEVLKAVIKKRPTDVGTDSPWLWVALAIMVIGLLWVVARMLPKTGGAP